MNDDELGPFLRSEIPEPGEGYWDQIDARIAAAAGERPEAPGEMQTNDNVVRLTDMNNIESPSSMSSMPRLLAMAAALVLIAGAAFLFTRDDDPDTTTDIADDGTTDDGTLDETPADPDDAAPDDGDATSDDDDAAPSEERSVEGIADEALGDALLESIDPGEYVVIGTEPVDAKLNPITIESGLNAVFVPGEGSLSSTGRRVTYEGETWHEMVFSDAKPLWFPDARLLLIGEPLPTIESATVVLWGTDPIHASLAPGFGTRLDAAANGGDTLRTTGERALIDHRVWIEVSLGGGAQAWIEVLDLVDEGGFAVETLPDFGPQEFEVGRGGELNLVDAPGFDGTTVGGAEIGGIVNATGRRVIANGLEWYEFAFPEGLTGWEMANTVQPVGTIAGTNRLCYRDGDNVLVLDFDNDANTFTGAFAYLDSVEAIAGVGPGPTFRVLAQPIGSGEEADGPIQTSEVWRAFAQGMSIGERAFLAFVECVEVQSTVDQLDALVGSYPPFPFSD